MLSHPHGVTRHSRWDHQNSYPSTHTAGWPSAAAPSVLCGYSAAFSVHRALGSRAQAGREVASLWLTVLRFLIPCSLNWVGGTHILAAMCPVSVSHWPSLHPFFSEPAVESEPGCVGLSI